MGRRKRGEQENEDAEEEGNSYLIAKPFMWCSIKNYASVQI
jgi:hypothetical protein